MTIKVFLADDHAIVRDGLKLLLQTQHDMEVAGEAAEGLEAVRKIGQIRPDIVIMDIAMPMLNGIDATCRIRKMAGPPPVIILSMHSSQEHILRAFKAGATGYLLKEAAGGELIGAIRAVRSGHRYLSEGIRERLPDVFSLHRQEGPDENILEQLSSREREVFQLVVEGKSSAQIAVILHLSPKTVETYRSRLMEKLGIRDIAGLVKLAIRQGLLSIE